MRPLTTTGKSTLGMLSRAGDLLSVVASFGLAMWLTERDVTPYGTLLLLSWAVLLFIFSAALTSAYEIGPDEPLSALLLRIFSAWGLTVLLLTLVGFLTKTSGDYSRVALTTWGALAPLLLFVVRIFLAQFMVVVRSRPKNRRRIAIVGFNEQGVRVAEGIKARAWWGIEVAGFFDDRVDVRETLNTDYEILGSSAELVRLARAREIDHVCITLPMRAEERIIELVNALTDSTVSVYFIPNTFFTDLLRCRITVVDETPVFALQEPPLAAAQAALKRAEDVIIGSLILVLIAVPMVLIAIAIKLSSPGPVLFKQRRYGLLGEIVEIWKFRSMTVCEDGDEIVQATRGDVRVTRLGAFMRKTSLDELPQFFNVLYGSMSIVGPRPHAVAHNEHYRKLVRGYMLRHKMKPGITGLAQISGWRGETETVAQMAKRIEFDLKYLNEWSLWLDLRIIVLTIFKGFVGTRAY